MQWSLASEEERMKEGTTFIALIWSEIASKIIEKAVHIYGLSSEQGNALKKAFRRYDIRPY
jgi:predicted nucleic acid-binding protein